MVPGGPAKERGILSGPGGQYPCALGRAGIRGDKREGDGATPAGLFPLRRVLYRSDRGAAPRSGLPTEPLSPDDGWCDDPDHAAYNTRVRLPFPARAERLWREDHLYDRLVVIGHNDDPAIPGRGSAVFIHVAAEGLAPTEGCIALERADLEALIAAVRPGDTIDIREGGD